MNIIVFEKHQTLFLTHAEFATAANRTFARATCILILYALPYATITNLSEYLRNST